MKGGEWLPTLLPLFNDLKTRVRRPTSVRPTISGSGVSEVGRGLSRKWRFGARTATIGKFIRLPRTTERALPRPTTLLLETHRVVGALKVLTGEREAREMDEEELTK